GFETIPYHDQLTDGNQACVANWTSRREFSTASFVLRDYDFQQSLVDLTVRQNATDSASTWDWYHFPGRYFDSDRGQDLARIRSEAQTAKDQDIGLEISSDGIQAGNLFTLQDHPLDDFNQEYLVTGTEIRATSQDLTVLGPGAASSSFFSQLTVQSSASPFRTPPRTKRVLMPGPQIATVVGPSDQEIWTDQYGRIKVKFAWDMNASNDDSCSCWIRVSQPWTGKGWGAIAIPRIGEEVIVQFLDGDVDRPIVIGRVYNAQHMPPEALADGQAKTVLRTRSTMDGEADNFHELSFDDTSGSERIFFQSERDFDRVVKNNDSLRVGFDGQDAGDQSIDIYNDQTLNVGQGSGTGNQTIEIAQNRSITIDSGDDQLLIQKGNGEITAAQGGISISGQTSLTLKCGGSSIELSTDGVTIKGSLVQIN
ncbi:MAG: type VI secretion system tip protein TssI/VgrG, partial [Planctomycetota bacterium]